MKRIALAATVVLVAIPALARAQSGRAGAGVRASANAGSGTTLSAEAQAKVDADLRTARARRLPEQPIRDRVAEGRAKGASEATIVVASGRALAELETSHDALVRAGRTRPSDEEVSRGAELVARGYTSAQIEAVARKAPADRSLVVAFETLSSLKARGVTTGRALAQVESRLAARASDAELQALASAGTNAAVQTEAVTGGADVGAGAAAGVAGSGAGVAGRAAAGASAAGSVGHGAAGLGGGISGGVRGVLGRP